MVNFGRFVMLCHPFVVNYHVLHARCLLRFAVSDAEQWTKTYSKISFHRAGDNYYYYFSGLMKTITYVCYLFSIQMNCNRIWINGNSKSHTRLRSDLLDFPISNSYACLITVTLKILRCMVKKKKTILSHLIRSYSQKYLYILSMSW